MKRKLFFFVVLNLMICNIIGCKKNGPPSLYNDDSTTGIFNYTGIVNDSVGVRDTSGGRVLLNIYVEKYEVSSHIIANKIQIERVSDSVLNLSKPTRDMYAYNTGLIFGTYPNFTYPIFNGNDSLIVAIISNNIFRISKQNNSLTSINSYVELYNREGKYINGKWYINYTTHGKNGSYLNGYHSYHLTCVKQQ